MSSHLTAFSVECTNSEIYKDPFFIDHIYEFVNSMDMYKWKSHEDDMCKLSAGYPDNIIVLKGWGESIDFDSPDIWRKVFMGGKMIKKEYAKLSW